MPASMQTVSAILKEVYQPKINEQLNNETKALKRVQRTSDGVDKIGGRDAFFAIHTGRNEGIGARREMELLPNAGQQSYARGHVGLTYQYGLVRVSGQTYELADKDYQTFASVVDQELTRIKSDLALDLNRQVYGNGTGAISKVASASGNVLTLNEALITKIRKGMTVDVYASNGTTVRAASRVVTAVDYDAKTVTLGGAAITGVVAGDFITREGNVNREWNGFENIISNTGNLHDVDPTQEPLWKSTVDNSGGQITELRMIEMAHKIVNQGSKTTAILTSQGLMRKYWSILQGTRQVVNTTKFTGGFSGLGFVTDEGEIPLVSDYQAPEGQMIYINENEMKILQTHDWKFMDRDGGTMWERVPGYDAYQATLYQYSNLATYRRNAHGKFTGLTES